jgi:osmotically-inducible protein OsmY
MIKIVKLCSIFVLSANIVSCVATSGQNNSNDYLDSSAVTMNVKNKLVNKLGPQAAAIKVKTYRDEVQLTGVVRNATIKQQAGEIAAHVGNVQHVRNDLMLQ